MRPRVRFAPSPTGALHIGGLRTALYNYLFAKKQGGDFILRIEDTDQSRYVPGAEEYIREALEWCGLELDEGPASGGEKGPYRQSERKDMYAAFGRRLVEGGWGYYAFDTAEELEARRQDFEAKGEKFSYNASTRHSLRNSLTLSRQEVEKLLESGADYTIRLKCPMDERIRFSDIVRGEVEFQSDLLDDKVMLKSDGMPTYHLANVVDDYQMGITHVIRGEEWLSSTAHHVLLYRALGWADSMPRFAHLPLILKPAPASYLHPKRLDGLADRLAAEFLRKNPAAGEAAKIAQRIKTFLQDKDNLAQRLKPKDKDKADKAAIKAFLKDTLFGKLSKRDGDRLGFPVFPLSWVPKREGEAAFVGFREVGFEPEALLNFLALLGWNPGTEQEIFSLSELVEAFSLDRIGKSGARFDYEKAKWFNQQYLIRGADAEWAERLLPLLREKGWACDLEKAAAVAGLFKERVTFLSEIPEKATFLFTDDFPMDEKNARKKWKPQHAEANGALVEKLAACEDFQADTLETLVKNHLEENELGFGPVMAPMRLALTGRAGGPSLFHILELLGKEKACQRLREGYARFAELKKA